MEVYSNMFSEESLRKIDKKKLELISKMLNDMYKKNAEEKMQVLFTYGMEMRSKGMSFTKEESELLMDVLKMNMSPQEKEKIEMVVNMMRSLG